MKKNTGDNVTVQQTPSKNDLSQIRKEIMQYYLNPQNTAVREYYDTDNIWKSLKIERDENRHSAFLAWFLKLDNERPNAPIYRFLALLVDRGEEKVKDDLIMAVAYHKLKIKNVDIDTEKYINELTTIQYKDRIDIFISGDIEGCGQYQKIEIIIENKVGAPEGGPKTTKEKEKEKIKKTPNNTKYSKKSQTERYYFACAECRNNYDSEKTLQLYVFLTPSEKGPNNNNFIKISYQDLVDYLFEPYLQSKGVNEYAKNAVKDYMRVLCNPNNKDNSILATMEEEKELLKDFYDRNVDLFLKAISVKKTIAKDEGDTELESLLNEQEQSTKETINKPSFTIKLGNEEIIHLKSPALWVAAAKIISFLLKGKNSKKKINTVFKQIHSPLIISEDEFKEQEDQDRWRKIEDTNFYITSQFTYNKTKKTRKPNFPIFMKKANDNYRKHGVRIEVIEKNDEESLS